MTLRKLIQDCIVSEIYFERASLALQETTGASIKYGGILKAIANCREHNHRLNGYLSTISKDELDREASDSDNIMIGDAPEAKRVLMGTIRNLV